MSSRLACREKMGPEGEIEGYINHMEDNPEWQEIHFMIIQTWFGIHDILKVFKRESQ